MGMLEQEIKELRKILRKVNAGEISVEDTTLLLQIYSQIEKRSKMILQSVTIGAKYGKPVLQRVLNTNLVGNNVAIDLNGELEEEIVMCPQNAKPIPRSVCLDHSGNPKNFDGCEKCEQFRTTRRMLIPSVK